MKQHRIIIDARIRRSSTGRYVAQLVEHLQDIDTENNYTILVAPDDEWRLHAANFTALPCPFPQFSFNPLHEFRFAWQLYHLKADLVHFSMTQQPLLYFGNIVTTTHDLTMLYFVRRGNTPKLLFWFKMTLYRFLMRWSHMKSRRIIVPAKTIAKEVAEFQPSTKDKLVVTYEDVGVMPKLESKKPSMVGGDYIMYQGSGFPHKNLEKLIEAFDIVSPRKPSLKLVLVGKREKNYEDLAKKIKAHPSAGNIILTGFLPDDESKWTFEHAKLFVMPSLSEGFGIPPLEAMAHGTPVVSSNTSVMPEIYGEGALYFDPRDPADIADKILQVLDNPELKDKLIANGRNQVKKYSWAKMAQETLGVYKSLLKD